MPMPLAVNLPIGSTAEALFFLIRAIASLWGNEITPASRMPAEVIVASFNLIFISGFYLIATDGSKKEGCEENPRTPLYPKSNLD